MKFVQHSDAHSYHDAIHNYLMKAELMNNIIIGLLSRMIHQGETFDSKVFLGHVENADGEIVASTMMAGQGVILSQIKDQDAIAVIVNAYAEHYEMVQDVVGEPDDSEEFARLWQQKRGHNYHTMMDYGYYQLEDVIQPNHVNGHSRLAEEDDFELLVNWLMQFNIDTGLDVNPSREFAKKNIRRKLEQPILGGIRIWMDDNQPVSMAAVTRELPNGGNISLVYTPKQYRGHGYASAITATVSQDVLDMGKSFSCLATDMSNPTSNKIYQAIGYQFVGYHRRIKFENPS
ncbi:MAG: GNAT family N-acetyltransferase [Chloroflexota bacterium]